MRAIFLTYRRISLRNRNGIPARYRDKPGKQAITTKSWIIITLVRDLFLQVPFFSDENGHFRIIPAHQFPRRLFRILAGIPENVYVK